MNIFLRWAALRIWRIRTFIPPSTLLSWSIVFMERTISIWFMQPIHGRASSYFDSMITIILADVIRTAFLIELADHLIVTILLTAIEANSIEVIDFDKNWLNRFACRRHRSWTIKMIRLQPSIQPSIFVLRTCRK